MSSLLKDQLEQQLASAQQELESWVRQGLTREDGSPAQDRRFEERGKSLRERVVDLTHQLDQLKENESRGFLAAQ